MHISRPARFWSISVVATLAVSVAANGCGRIGFETGSLAADTILALEESSFETGTDFVTFGGSCIDGFPVQTSLAPAACEDGRFLFQTPIETSDGLRSYSFRQTIDGESVEVTGRWLRNAETPVLILDRDAIFSSLETATFEGDCSSFAGNVRVQTANASTTVSCSGNRFSYTTAVTTTDQTRLYTFEQTNLLGVRRTATGHWTREASLPRLELDQAMIADGANTATFSGACESSSGDVAVDEPSGRFTTPCSGDRFIYTTSDQTSDGLRSYLFTQTKGSGESATVTGRWSRERSPQALSTAGTATDDGFGDSIATDGNVIVVGAPGDDTVGTNHGAVYIYRYGNGTWGNPTQLTLPASGRARRFGEDVALADDVLIVGADGGSHPMFCVYDRVGEAEFLERQCIEGTSAEFGNRIDYDGVTLIVSAKGEDASAGAVYVYERDSEGAFRQRARLVASNRMADEQFGIRIAVDGEWIVVARRQAVSEIFRGTGSDWSRVTTQSPEFVANSVYPSLLEGLKQVGSRVIVNPQAPDDIQIFAYDLNEWRLETTLTNSAIEFGAAVALGTSCAIVSAPGAGPGATGRAFVYGRSGTSWSQRGTRSGPLAGDRMGESEIDTEDGLVVLSNETTRKIHVFRLASPC